MSEWKFIKTLKETLNEYTVDQLKPLLSLLKIVEKPKRKAEIIATIENYVKTNLKQLWQQLDESQQLAVAETVYSDNLQFDLNRFRAKYQKPVDFGTEYQWGYYRNPSLIQLFLYNQNLPLDLQKELKKFVPEPKKDKIDAISELPKTIRQIKNYWERNENESNYEEIPLEIRYTEKTALQDLKGILQLVSLNKISVSDKTKQPSAATQRQIMKIITDGDYYTDPPKEEQEEYYQVIGSIRPFALPLIIQAAGWAKLSGTKLALTNSGKKALNNFNEDCIKTAWEKWLSTKIIDEFRRINEIKGQTGRGKRTFTPVVERRNALAEALYNCQPNRWLQIEEFFRHLKASNYDLEVCTDPWQLYICEDGYGNLGYDGFHSWNILEGRYTLCFLFEYAASLGIIDVAYIPPHNARHDFHENWGTDDLEFLSRYDGLWYIRITPLGAYCLGQKTNYTPPVVEKQEILKVLPNLEIVALSHHLTSGDRLILDQYTKKISDTVWQLDEKILLKAIGNGYTVKELQDFLTQNSSECFPETVTQFFKDLEQRSNSIEEKGMAKLIECKDVSLAHLIANDSRTKKYCILAGEKSLVVPIDMENKFRNALQKIGYTL